MNISLWVRDLASPAATGAPAVVPRLSCGPATEVMEFLPAAGPRTCDDRRADRRERRAVTIDVGAGTDGLRSAR